MNHLIALIVDLTEQGNCLQGILRERYRAEVTRIPERVHDAIAQVDPFVICFEFDTPNARTLTHLSEVKRNNPSIPVIMATEQHSETLAVWALRTRVWDYFVKPVDTGQLLRCVSMIHRLPHRSNGEQRSMVRPPLPAVGASTPKPGAPNRIIPIVRDYVRKHLNQRIREEDVARQCGLTRCQFSRNFRKHAGITFQDYVITARIQEASRLLSGADTSVTEVCWAVGFRDLSHFSRTFRRHFGVSPSQFRKCDNFLPLYCDSPVRDISLSQ